MTRNPLAIIAAFLLLLPLVGGCGSSTGASSDPYEGFFAHPSVGYIELRRSGEQYVGGLAVDFGPFPITLVPAGDVLRGTVTYGGRANPITVQRADGGSVVVDMDGTRTVPLRRYRDMEAYKAWRDKNPGNGGTGIAYEAPATGPAKPAGP